MSQRILHVLFGYYPDAVGGTEVYVEALARYQTQVGDVVAIAAPGEHDAQYEHRGLAVFRYALNPVDDLSELYGEGDALGASSLENIAKTFQADIVHFHAFTRGVSLLAAKKCRALGAALVITYHTPTVSCARGTMMRWGETACSGKLSLEPCVACALQSKKIPSVFARALSILPTAWSRSSQHLPASATTTALRLPAMLKMREQTCLELFALADHWVGVCDWVCDVLRRNGVEEKRLTLSRQGVTRHLDKAKTSANTEVSGLRAVMLGRIDVAKGWHIVLDAMKKMPADSITVDAYAVSQGEVSAYERALRKQAEAVSAFRWCQPLPSEKMLEQLSNYDVLLVPSQWLETGPLVVLEAFEAGLPVVGSHLGGIAELVQDQKTGALISPYDDATAWANQLTAIAQNKNILKAWQANIKKPRSMSAACEDMVEVYRSALVRRAVQP
jgi:glycosyltransferase involved in cell wall biosynthesis